MIVGIMQPHFVGWDGLYDYIDQCDIFVFLDNVKTERQSWQVRNRIRTNNKVGWQWITLPVNAKSETKISETQFCNDRNWRRKIIETIKNNYPNKTNPYNKERMSFVESLINCDSNLLGGYNRTIITRIAREIGITTSFIMSSSLRSNGNEGSKDARLVNIIKELGGDTYLSALGGANYIELDRPGGAIVESGINLLYQKYTDWNHNPSLCIIDRLIREGEFESILPNIKVGRNQPYSYLEVREKLKGVKSDNI